MTSFRPFDNHLDRALAEALLREAVAALVVLVALPHVLERPVAFRAGEGLG